MSLQRFAAFWRESYVTSDEAKANSHDRGECVFCALLRDGVNDETGVLAASEFSFVTLNAYPYGSGHLLVLPRRHVSDLASLSREEYADLMNVVRTTSDALQSAYQPDGMNIGFNLGSAAGAGIPKHLHAHVLPRWHGDTNFMTAVGETRVLPESLAATYQKVSPLLARDLR